MSKRLQGSCTTPNPPSSSRARGRVGPLELWLCRTQISQEPAKTQVRTQAKTEAQDTSQDTRRPTPTDSGGLDSLVDKEVKMAPDDVEDAFERHLRVAGHTLCRLSLQPQRKSGEARAWQAVFDVPAASSVLWP